MQTNVRSCIFITMSILFLMNFIYAILYFAGSFPNGYVWGELFIKYTDGLVRRGLIGSILFFFADFFNICLLWTVFITIVYCVFFIKVYYLFRTTVTYFFTIVLFFSPALIAFFVKDQNLYGRKDIIVISLLFISMSVCAKILMEMKSTKMRWVTVALCYITAFLVHEITLFFSLLPAILVIAAAGCRKYLAASLIIAVFCLSALFAVHFQGTDAMRDLMFQDWKSVLENFTTQGGMRFIGKQVGKHEAVPLVWLQNHSLLVSYIEAWLLALLPVALLMYVYRFHMVCTSVIGRLLTWVSYLCALFPVVALTAMINDFGRIISYSILFFLFFMLFIMNAYREKYGSLPVRSCIEKLDFSYLPVLVASLYYLLCWKLYHYVPLHMDPKIISISV